MFFSMAEEAAVFFYSCLAGVLIMVFYDLISVAGKKQRCPVFILNVCDGIFIVVACAIMVFITFSVSNGIVRGFEFAGAVLGALLYKLTLSRFLSAFFYKICGLVSAFFKIFFKILLTPLEFTYKMVSKCIGVLLRPVVSVVRKMVSHFSFRARFALRTARKAMKKT